MPIDHLLTPAPVGEIRVEAEACEPEHPGTLELRAYWRSKIEPCGIPLRSAIRPQEIPRLLPNLFIAEPVDGDWRLRLIAAGVSSRFGVDLTGKMLREVFNDEAAEFLADAYDWAALYRRARCYRGHYLGFAQAHLPAEAIHLPVLAADRETVLVFGGVFFPDEI
jgi:hypothetical protein